MTTTTTPTPELEAKLALCALYLAVDETVAKDVALKVDAWIAAERAIHQETQATFRQLSQAYLDERVAYKETQAISRKLLSALEPFVKAILEPDTMSGLVLARAEAAITKAKDMFGKNAMVQSDFRDDEPSHPLKVLRPGREVKPTTPTFAISGTELENLNAWLEKHDQVCRYADPENQGAIGGRFTFSFIPTSICEFQKVVCACGEECDLTDYGSI